MAPQGLNGLNELASEVDELREQAGKLMVRLITLYLKDEDVENLGAHNSLTKATVSLQKAAWRLWHAVTEIRDAHKFEKDLMDFYEGLRNKLHDDKARTK
ncbi:hypothetical protein [uncultured Porphyromonas sp.]|uniref:hypothetical protein n=1 Tax=uncultured Porphyromonas sp. TaxID=159274 RepID=UPI002621F7F6|nr:hypothetical protein [uncultured Porphyromonas sp.]